MQGFSDASPTSGKPSAMLSSNSMRRCFCSSIRKRPWATMREFRPMELADKGTSAFGSRRIRRRPGSGASPGLGSRSRWSTPGPTVRSRSIFAIRQATASNWLRGGFGATSESSAKRVRGAPSPPGLKRLKPRPGECLTACSETNLRTHDLQGDPGFPAGDHVLVLFRRASSLFLQSAQTRSRAVTL
jgi:hypothetical protein